MIRYRLSPKAATDLDSIWSYSVAQWDDDQAEAYLRMIEGRLAGLVAGRIPPRSAEDVRPGYFRCSAGSHMIYYRIKDDEIIVVRILHQSMDVYRRLSD